MNKKKLQVVLLSLSLLHCFSANAFTDGSAAILAQQLAQLKAEYEEIVEQVRQLKIVNDHLDGVVDGIQAVKREYDFVNNFDLQREMGRISRDVETLTTINTLLTDQNRLDNIDRILRELDRLTVSTNESDRVTEAINELESKLLAYRSAVEAFGRESATTPGNATQADLTASIKSSTAAIAAQTLAKREEELRERIRRQEQLIEMVQNDQNILNYLDGKEVK